MNLTSAFWLGAAAALLGGACGGSVVIGDHDSGTTGGGAGPATTGGTGVSVGTGGSVGTSVGAGTGGSVDPGTGGGFGGGEGTGGAGGSGAICGGFTGTPCPSGQYCSFPDKQCGGNDSSGTCVPLATNCPPLYAPVCGCDHHVYPTECKANASGADVDDSGGCTPPGGLFGCGSEFCDVGKEYCRLLITNADDQPPQVSCWPLPTTCGTTPTCDCLTGEPCSDACMVTPDGDGLEIACEPV
jgi:hypothetical protein